MVIRFFWLVQSCTGRTAVRLIERLIRCDRAGRDRSEAIGVACARRWRRETVGEGGGKEMYGFQA